MKKQTAVAGILILAIAGFSASSALADVDVSTEVEHNSGGGLGEGLNHMVRSILGESQESEAPIAPQAAPAATLMMQTNADAGTAPSPEARQMTYKAAPASAMLMASVVTEEGLHEHMQALMRDDSNLQTVDTSETHVRITYTVQTKAFRFVPVTARVTVGVYASGGTEVSYPWFAFATKRLSNEFKARVRSHLEAGIPSGEFTLEDQERLIGDIHAALVAEFGASVRGGR